MFQFRQIDLDIIPALVGVDRTVARQEVLQGCRLVGARQVVRRSLCLDFFLPGGQVERIVVVRRRLGDHLVHRVTAFRMAPLPCVPDRASSDLFSRLERAPDATEGMSIECPFVGPVMVDPVVVVLILRR